MVWRWGMGKSGIIGNFYSLDSAWHGQTLAERISEKTREKLDEDTQSIMRQCLEDVTGILSEEKELLEYFAQELLRKGELEYDEIIEIFKKYGKRRFQESTD